MLKLNDALASTTIEDLLTRGAVCLLKDGRLARYVKFAGGPYYACSVRDLRAIEARGGDTNAALAVRRYAENDIECVIEGVAHLEALRARAASDGRAEDALDAEYLIAQRVARALHAVEGGKGA